MKIQLPLYINSHLIKTMLPKSKIGGAAERSEAEGAAKRSFAESWQSSKLKIIITILIIICLNSSTLLANEEQTKADTMAEIYRLFAC